MANNLDLQGRIDIEFGDAIDGFGELARAADKAINALADTGGLEELQAALGNSLTQVHNLKQAMEELRQLSSADLGTALKLEQEVGVGGNYGEALRRIAAEHKGVQDEINSYARQANEQYLQIQEQGRERELSILRSTIQERYKAEQEAEDARTQYARQANEQHIQAQEQGRQKDLAQLRIAIQERHKAEQQAEEARSQYAKQANQQYLQIQEQARKEELAGLRAAILEREQIQRDHAEAMQMNVKFDQDAAYETYKPNIKYVQQMEEGYNKLANTRYALYDVATTFTIISGATLGAAAAAVKFSADYEQAFKSVERTTLTTAQAAQDLKQDLIALTTEIPRSFDEITDIATLGAQMDIPTQHLEKFTETVAMFASTTDASVDKAAMSLGRLAQLTKTSVEDIDRLASAIYFTGINSVATEEQILTISEQIAASGNLAGFAADEIIGLSAAMASLGVQPEAARGAIMRIFNNIRMAVDESGEAVEKFAQVAGTSVEDFSKVWLTEPERAFSMLVEGLHRLSNEGQAVSGVLKDLGMSNVRDLRVMELLADNTDVYAAAMSNAASSYEENSALADGYATQVDNLNDALTVLWNSLKAIGAEVGDIPILKDMVVWATEAVKWFGNLLKMPIVGWVAKISLGVIAAVGAFAAWQAMSARLTASAYGLITAMRGIQKSSGVANTGLKGLWQGMLALINMNRTMRNEVALTNTQLERMHISALRAQGSISGFGAATRTVGTFARGAMGAATSFMSSMVVPAAVIGGIAALTAGIKTVSDSLKDAETRSKDFFGSTTGLREALVEDGRIFEESGGKIGVYVDKVSESAEKSKEAAGAYFKAEEGQIVLKGAYDKTTGSIEEQTVAMGENVRAILSNKIVDHLEDLDQAGKDLVNTLDWKEVMTRLENDVANGTNTAAEYMGKFTGDIEEGADAVDALIATFDDLDPMSYAGNAEELRNLILEPWDEIPEVLRNKVDPAVTETIENIRTMSESELLAFEWTEFRNQLADLEAMANSVADVVNTIGVSLEGEGLLDYFKGLAISAGIAADITGDLGAAADGAGDEMDELAGKTESVLDAFDRLHIPAMAAEEAVENLGASLYENGINFDIYSEGGRANFQALDSAIEAFVNNADGDLAQLDDSFLAMVIGLQEKGVVFEGELAYVADILQEVFAKKYNMDISTAAARGNLAMFINAAIEALQVQARLAGENLQAATSWGAAQHYHDELVTAERALADFTAARDNALSASDERGGIEQIGALERGWNRARDAAVGRSGSGGAGGAGRKAAKDIAKAAKKAQKEVRTLADYVSDLSSTMSRAFEFRFGVSQSKDATADIFSTIRQNAEDARDAVKKALQDIMDADAKLKGLKSDRQILQYQLTVAEEYNDTLRAAEIRAEIAEKNAEIKKTEDEKAEAQKRAKKAQEDSSMTLKGNSDAARKNRSDMESLVQSYQKQIEALANSNLSSKDLQRETEKLRQDFIKQSTQLGFNRKEVEKYAKSFDDMATIIKNIPKNITVNADVGPARRALNEFIAKKEKSKTIPTTTGKPSAASTNAARKAAGGSKPVTIPTRVSAPTNTKSVANSFIAAFRVALKAANFAASLFGKKIGALKFYRDGGFTGRGPAGQVAGITHKGEYVVRKEFVNQSTGLPDMNALGQHLGMNTYAGSVSSAPGPSVTVVELSARDRQLLAAAGNVTLTVDGRVMAKTTNQHNLNSARRGVG